jgi:hypothetical protein
MRLPAGILLISAAAIECGCSGPSPETIEVKLRPLPPSAKITQFYATLPKMQPGDKQLLCYGVENATAVWLSPPRQQLTASLSRCIEVAPAATTIFRLSAEGADGKTVVQDLTVTVGAPRAKIIEVRVNTLNAKRGETVSICYGAANVKSVTIDPIGYKGGANVHGCATHQPGGTTTYVVTAIGPDGDRDQEKVTIKVQ